MDSRLRYNRAVGIASFICESHTIEETKEEFGISKDTISRELDFLSYYGYGKENAKNLKLFMDAKNELKRH